MSLDPRHLSQLATIAQLGSFSAAADRLGLAQSALSRNIKALERSVGAPVLLRGRRGVIPTEIGASLAQFGEVILSANAQATEAAASITSVAATQLRVAATRLIGENFLVEPLARFMASRDKVVCRLRIGQVEDLVRFVALGEADLAIGHFAALSEADGDLHVDRLTNDHMAVLARPGHPIVEDDGDIVARLAESRWIVPWPGSALRRQIEIALRYMGVDRMKIAYETPSTAAAIALVKASDCVCVLPRFGIFPLLQSGQIVEITLARSPINRPIGILTLAERRNSQLIEAFSRELRTRVRNTPGIATASEPG